MDRYILALDQGTTSSRAILFDRRGRPVARAQKELPQILPGPGLVEHDPEAIWLTQWEVARQVLVQAGISPRQIAGVGVTNQRETTILWDRATGKPVANAIVWQSRVSTPICERWKSEGFEPLIRERTGLVVDPYFSASKVAYLLESIDGLRTRCERGEVLFGTVDTWLVWQLSGGKLHVTDPSNASRTMFFNIHTLEWDAELLRAMQIPAAILPRVCPSSGIIGTTAKGVLGEEIPIAGIAGDQQAATFGQVCFRPGTAKNTYGTGCFMLMNTGDKPVPSANNLLTTVGWQIGNKVTYCLEGSVFIAGAVVQWLRDNLGVIRSSSEVEELASKVPDSGGVYFVPAFVGLGAPHWDPYARGAIFGLSRNTTVAHIARAALESMAYQTKDLVRAMERDSGVPLSSLRVDGGASANNILMQFQADILGVPVCRPQVQETTALGAAFLAGLAVGFWESEETLGQLWTLDREFVPQMDETERSARYQRWCEAVSRVRNWEAPKVE